jgi:hypothetical protein
MGRPKKIVEAVIDAPAVADALPTETTPVEATQAAPRKAKKAPARQCIAPRCRQMGLGPRNRHLCANHKATPLETVRAWQEKARA